MTDQNAKPVLVDIEQVSVNLTNAQLTHLHSAPVTLVPAPGAGKVIIPMLVTGNLIYGGAAFAAAVPDLFYGTTAGVSASSAQATVQAWLRAAANEVYLDNSLASGAKQGAIATLANLPIIFGDNAADDASGSSTATMTVTYAVITL